MSLTSSMTECNCQVCLHSASLCSNLGPEAGCCKVCYGFPQSLLVDSRYNDLLVYECNSFLETTHQLITCKTESHCPITSNVIKCSQFKKSNISSHTYKVYLTTAQNGWVEHITLMACHCIYPLCMHSYISRVYLGFVVIRVAVGKVSVGVLWLPLSISFHQCTILIHLTTLSTVI
jgi:hypothetical protein